MVLVKLNKLSKKEGSKLKVSIILPVYNVEKYLAKSIESIQAQTFSDFELIIVNDGSTDSSATIAKSYAESDSRIILVNKENGGVSDARNYGLSKATTDWITFIDPDDYIEPNYLDVLISGAERSQADIIIAGVAIDFANNTSFRRPSLAEQLAPVDALRRLLLGDGFDQSAWAKLYSRSSLGELRFLKGYLFEDLLFTTEALKQAKAVFVTPEVVYHYIIRENSITTSTFNQSKLQLVEIAKMVHKNMIEYRSCLKPYADDRLLWAYFSTLNQTFKSNSAEAHTEAVRLRKEVLAEKRMILQREVSIRNKIAYIALTLGLGTYRRMSKLEKLLKRHRAASQ